MLRIFILGLLLLISSSGHSAGIVVIGDSLSAAYGMDESQGWVNLLRQRLKAQGLSESVVNASISGDTTRGGLARLPALLEQHRPDLVIIELGGNDGLRGLSLKAMRKNLSKMVELSRAAGAETVLAGVRLPPNYGRAYTERFHRVYQRLHERQSVKLVPYILAGVDDRPEWMQADGIHPSAEGQSRILENVWPVILPVLTDKQR